LTLWRWAFVGYAAAVFIATHWPRLRVEGPLPRTDLWIHVAAFGLWALLLGLTRWVRSERIAPAVLLWLIGAGYGIVDEISQGIPVLGRTVALEDAAANVCGVTVGVVAFVLVRRLRNAGRIG
jgi:VanZ family protein